MEAALTRLAQQASNSAGLFRFFLYLTIALPPGLTLFPAVGSGNWTVFYSATAASLALILLAFWYQHSLRLDLRRRLASSGLYLRLALDGLEHDAIFDQCPWPWRGMLPRNSSSSLLPTLRRLGRNLDFYLSSRSFLANRLQLALFWSIALCWPILCFRVLADYWRLLVQIWPQFAGGSQAAVPLPLPDMHIWLILAFWMLLALVLVFLTFRRQVWIEELVTYLQASLQG